MYWAYRGQLVPTGPPERGLLRSESPGRVGLVRAHTWGRGRKSDNSGAVAPPGSNSGSASSLIAQSGKLAANDAGGLPDIMAEHGAF